MKREKDEIFNSPLEKIVDFKFDEKVANVFEDMIQRSIPGYATIINMIGMFAGLYIKPGTNVYDLGCSLGAASFAMARKIEAENVKIIAVDNSPQMIARAKELQGEKDNAIDFICDDILNIEMENASMAALNFTLQFISPNLRAGLLKKIYESLIEEGVLLLSEKISFEDSDLEKRQSERYYNFKRLNGYSDLEISQKRDALENVLIPESLQTHFNRLKSAGFSTVDLWYQCFNFISIIAVK